MRSPWRQSASQLRASAMHGDESIANFATTQTISFPPQMAIRDVFREYRNKAGSADVVMYIYVVDESGIARTGAYFATAPFLGTLAAISFLHEPITVQLLAAGFLMALGVWLHLNEDHTHEHEHRSIEHTHLHKHDEHHHHAHGPGEPTGEPHTHVHRHEPIRHNHPHVPDMHHTHRH